VPEGDNKTRQGQEDSSVIMEHHATSVLERIDIPGSLVSRRERPDSSFIWDHARMIVNLLAGSRSASVPCDFERTDVTRV
jgi:hypothetical protein